jgi:hypothetical protein
MSSAHSKKTPDTGSAKARDGSRERQCIVTRDRLPPEEMIRFVLAPDNTIVPDLEERLPGRGLWLTASRDIVERACVSRAFAKAARAPVLVESGLTERLEGLLRKRCLNLLGLARRAGAAVSGFEKARAFSHRNPAGLAMLASDGAEDGVRKFLAGLSGVPVAGVLSADELGAVFGRDRAVYVTVAQGALAQNLLKELRRLEGFTAARLES